ILNDFLSLGKLEEGKVELTMQSLNLDELLKEIRDELKNSLREGQYIEIQIQDNLTDIMTDSKILRNILFNLLSNASKYSDNHKSIQLTVEKNQNDLLLHVKDEGIGIPKDDQRHLFDRFFRAGNVSNIQGTGLGLHIVKRYVDLLGGVISFESLQNKGTTFSVSIPQHS
ncbi:MAG TPA: ATP-binding protein, partial [Cyclobacteriaceae bacterium]|nr:ATP-binding protein [Cyclobacteriaceae bacterium]